MNKYLLSVGSFIACSALFTVMTGSVVFAVTFMALLAIHELGHYFAAQHIGLPVSVPVFTPLGAFINMPGLPRNASQEAYMAYGGPFLGTLGAIVALVAGVFARSPEVVQAAYYGFFLNLFNLIPWSPMDGGRISQVLSRHLWVVGAACLALFAFSQPLGSMSMMVIFLVVWMGFQDIANRNRIAEQVPEYYQVPATVRIGYLLGYVGLAALCFGAIAFYPAVVKFLVQVLG